MHNTLSSELESLQPMALDAGLVFSGKASGRLIQGYAQPSAYTPLLNADYLFHESSHRPAMEFILAQQRAQKTPGSAGGV